MKCPACECHEMEIKVCDETLTCGSESLTLHNMEGHFCPLCGEGVWNEESYRRYTAAQEELVKKNRG